MLVVGTEAVSVQVPLVKKLAVLPETVQTDGVVDPNVTVPFEVDVALRVAVVPAVCVPRAGNVIVCTLKFTVTF